MAEERPPLVVIGNPENRRVTLFCDAALRLGFAPPQTIGYAGLLAGEIDLAAAIGPGTVVRLESPGENAAVTAALVRRGALLQGRDPQETGALVAASMEPGRIAATAQWYAGYRQLLAEIGAALPGVHWMNHPADVPVLFDKTECHAQLAACGVRVPPALPLETSQPGCGDELLAQLARAGWARVFVKLRYGSSASGVVALERSPRRLQATTSAELVREAGRVRLYNSLRVRRYTDPADIADMLDELCRQQVHVERWIPKAGLNGRTFDLRIVAIGGQPRQMVVRTSPGPITNLHLGNRRGDLAALDRAWPAAAREAAWETCRAAAACFPRSLYCGIDLALEPGLVRHAVLELNAFGDLLPGITDERGDDTYASQLRTLLVRT